MRIGDKAQLSPTANRSLICVHGSASVLTITGVAAGVVFLRHDWTHSEFMADENEISVMESDDAAIQAMIYQAHLDIVREKREARQTRRK